MDEPSRRSAPRSVLDDASFPTALAAHVVSPGRPPRIHGYDAEGDLAPHYRFTDTVLLALTGELPSDAAGRAFDAAMHFLAPISVAEAPAHAAILAQLCMATPAGVVSVGALGLAQQARRTLLDHAELLAWLGDAAGAEAAPRAQPPLPARFRASDEVEAASVRRLRDALAPSGLSARGLGEDPGLWPALLCVLHACGLTMPAQMEAALVVARLPCVVAEALRHRPGDLRSYPVNVPPFRYEDAPERGEGP